MALPIVSWWNSTNDTEILSWPIGTIDAGQYSNNFTVLIWNNRGGADPAGEEDLIISDMQNVKITTKDNKGGHNLALVEEKWIQVKCDSLGETDFTAIGGDASHPIRTNGTTVNEDGEFTPGEPPHSSDNGSVDILGVWNDGTLENAAGNYVKVTLRAFVPSTSNAGMVNFLTRVQFQWV